MELPRDAAELNQADTLSDGSTTKVKAVDSLEQSILSLHRQKASWAFTTGIIFYVGCLICAATMIIIGFLSFFRPSLSFLQKSFTVGIFVVGSLLIVTLVFKNPLVVLQNYLNEFIRIQIVLSEFQAEQSAYLHEINAIQNQASPCDAEKLDKCIKNFREGTERSMKNINSREEWLE